MSRLLTAILTLLVTLCTACGSNSAGSTRGGAAPAASQGRLNTVADVQLPGDTSRWDYQALDPQSHRLFIAHLGAGEVVVYDTAQGTVVGTVRGVAGVHGVIAVPELRRVYASATVFKRP